MLDEDDVLGVMDDYVEEAYDEEDGDRDGGDESGGEGGEEGGGRRGLMSGAGRRGIAAVGALFQRGRGSGGGSNAMKALPLTGISGRRAQALAKQGFSYQLGDSDEDGDDGPLRPGGR